MIALHVNFRISKRDCVAFDFLILLSNSKGVEHTTLVLISCSFAICNNATVPPDPIPPPREVTIIIWLIFSIRFLNLFLCTNIQALPKIMLRPQLSPSIKQYPTRIFLWAFEIFNVSSSESITANLIFLFLFTEYNLLTTLIPP